MREERCDILVVGASLGGVAASMSAASFGASVILVEESGWIGGQLTSQGVCTPDENRWIESGGGTASYLALRQQIRDYYRSEFRLSAYGEAQALLNPGSCWVSRISVEPKVAQRLLLERISEHPGISLRLQSRVLAVHSTGDTLTAADILTAGSGPARIRFAYALDATDLGDLLPLAGVEHVIGAESFSETGEPDAPPQPRPDWIQPFTFPFALELRPRGENHAIPAPPDYAELKALQQYHVLDGAMRGMFGELSWWTYRRVIAAQNFDDPRFPFDVAMINTGSNDFLGGVIPGEDAAQDARTLARGRLASLGYVRWLQSECPREDRPGEYGYPEMKLRKDWFDTADGIAPAPYIRESRRIRARKTVLQQEIVAADSSGREWQRGPRAAFFADSVGIGHYWLDIHRGGTAEPGLFLETRPFQIPLGALVPVRAANLIPACKNAGVTHLTNGAYRLHPIEWNIGESAGALAAFCLAVGAVPAEVHADSTLLRRFQLTLLRRGVPLYWWGDLSPDSPAFESAQRLAMDGWWPEEPCVEFRPEDPLSESDRGRIEQRMGSRPEWARAPITRGQAAEEWARSVYTE